MVSAKARALPQAKDQPLAPCPKFNHSPGRPLAPTTGFRVEGGKLRIR